MVLQEPVFLSYHFLSTGSYFEVLGCCHLSELLNIAKDSSWLHCIAQHCIVQQSRSDKLAWSFLKCMIFCIAFVHSFFKSVLCRNSVTQVKPFFRGFFHIATCHATILIIKQPCHYTQSSWDSLWTLYSKLLGGHSFEDGIKDGGIA